jgi:predicted dehydrogenase
MRRAQIRLGVIGLRNNGLSHARRIVELEDCRLVAAADRDPERCTAAAGLAPGVTTYAHADDLLAADDVDAVVLSLPNHLHASLSIAALNAGKHVLVEKPMAMTVAEAETMIRARDASGKVLMPGMNQRFEPKHQAIKAAIDAGQIGSIYAAKTSWLMGRVLSGIWGRGDWFLKQETAGGGPIIDLGVHRLDLALYLMGFPQAVSVSAINWHTVGPQQGRARGKEYSIEDGGIALIRFANGASMLLEASYFWNGLADGQSTELAGTQGGALLAGECRLARWEGDAAKDVPIAVDAGRATSCVEHFVRVLRGQEALIPTAEQGLASLRIIEAIYRSARSGEEVKL